MDGFLFFPSEYSRIFTEVLSMWFSLQWLFPTSFSKHPLVLFFCMRVYVFTLCVIVRLVHQHEHNSKIWEYSIISRHTFIYVIDFLSLFSSFPCSVHGNQFQILGCWKKKIKIKNLFLLPEECKWNLSCSSETAEVFFLFFISGTVCEHSVCPGEAFQSFLTELQF